MKIASDMDLNQLIERMSLTCGVANIDEAEEMRRLLNRDAEAYGWMDTQDVEDTDWFRMLDASVRE